MEIILRRLIDLFEDCVDGFWKYLRIVEKFSGKEKCKRSMGIFVTNLYRCIKLSKNI